MSDILSYTGHTLFEVLSVPDEPAEIHLTLGLVSGVPLYYP